MTRETPETADPADLVSLVTDAARRWPTRAAWTFDDGTSRHDAVRRFTYAEVERLVAAHAEGLRERGVTAGDRVGVLLRNTPEFPLVWLALARLGAAMVPLNVRYRSVDLAHVLEASSAVAVVSSNEFEPLLRETACEVVLDVRDLPSRSIDVPAGGPAPVAPTTTANVQFTSGTTGLPKGCVLSHGYWITLGRSLVEEFPRLEADDVMLTAQPFSYLDPMWNVVASMLAGAELVVLDGFHPSSFWAKVREHQVTYFYCLGAMPALLLRMPPDEADRDHRVRVVQASAIPPSLHAELEARWGVGWFETFGMTETGADLRITDLDHDDLVGTGCLGRPASHREATIVEGELWLRGRGMMDGYLDPTGGLTDPFVDGWFATGDLARIDDAGRVYLQGRLKDMIRRSGENVAAHEVEDVIASHPGVRLVAVIGVPDDLRGEEVKAYVVGTATPEELTAWCTARLASFKVPRYWEHRDDLPRTASERVAKQLLREEPAEVGAP